MAPTKAMVAKGEEIRQQLIERASDEQKAMLAQRKNLHLIAAKMSEMNWGKGLDEVTRRAVASYLERNRLDLTEVDVLGGNLYRNARYYKRRLAEMVEDGLVTYVKSDFVHQDARLQTHAASTDLETAKWASAEILRRLQVRIEYGIPDAAVGACVTRIKLANVDEEITAAKWCGGGTRKSDPVGESFPIETSETRSCRRAMLLCASSIPALRWVENELTDSGIEISKTITEGRVYGREEIQQAPPMAHAGMLAQPADGDLYDAPAISSDNPIEHDGE